MQAYSYQQRHQNTLHAARTVLSLLCERVGPLSSAVDLGCGVGTWLSVAREQGAQEILGLDGPWVDRELLVIPQQAFRQVALGEIDAGPRRYHLAISLEVAEHLPAARADPFVSALTGLADLVLFSAAIPGQGGRNHVNEQWPQYWVEKFDRAGYAVHDFIRPHIWSDERIPYWYRQNILLFARRDGSARLGLPAETLDDGSCPPLDLVHPEMLRRALKGARRPPGWVPRPWKRYWRQVLGRS